MAYMTDIDQVPKKGKGSKLSAKMRLFVSEYCVDFVATKAVIRAGYKTGNPEKMATELMNHPLIKLEIEKRMQRREKRSEVKAEYLIDKLLKIIEDTEEANPQAALRAIELAGKSIALWKERQEISGPDGEAIKTEQRVREDVADFSRKLAGLVAAGGKGTVVKFPDGSSES